MLPPASFVTVRIPGAETAPTPQEGEIVVFDEHFYRGFGLPASTFFSNWLVFFSLQLHHLAPNAILQLSSFVILCEGFLWIEPCLDLWQSLFFLKQQSRKMEKAELEKLDDPRPMTPCGAALVHHRSKSGFPQMPLQGSIKQWQKGFFYVKNVSPAHDALNMPPFNIDPPMEKLNWQAKYPKLIPEVAQIGAYLDNLKGRSLLGRDLLTTMVTRRILPLQRRPHLVCQMSGRYDPCWTSTKSFTASAVAQGVNQISAAHMDDGGNWEWGMAPYEKSRPPPMVSPLVEAVLVVFLVVDHLFEPVADPIAQMFEKLQALNPPAPDVATSDASEIEDEVMIKSRSAASEGSEDALESEGTEPSGEHLKPFIVDWTDDDETPPSLCDAAFEEDSNAVEEVTSPPLTRGRRHAAETAGLGEAARRKGKGATASRPAPKEAEDVEEDTASAVERAGWAAVDAAQKEIEEQSARCWEVVAEKMAEGRPRPSRVEKPAERRTKARHDPSTRAGVEEPASEAAPRRAWRTEAAKLSEPDASAPVDLEEIPESPEAEVAADAPELNLNALEVAMDVPKVSMDAPEVVMDAPDAANPPPAMETAPAGTSVEPAAIPTLGDGTIVISNRAPGAPGASPRAGSRPMKAWRVANLELQMLPARTIL
ncbi:hypothetical protein D1007_21743 [Hordeum vulgare]|nr:hypothetical protein D1007_21743 [Hordeum vulgare]